jgi:hypothetical protein
MYFKRTNCTGRKKNNFGHLKNSVAYTWLCSNSWHTVQYYCLKTSLWKEKKLWNSGLKYSKQFMKNPQIRWHKSGSFVLLYSRYEGQVWVDWRSFLPTPNTQPPFTKMKYNDIFHIKCGKLIHWLHTARLFNTLIMYCTWNTFPSIYFDNLKHAKPGEKILSMWVKVRNKVRRYLPPYPHSLIKTIFTEKTGTSEGTERLLTANCHSSPIVGTISVGSLFFHRVDAKVPMPWVTALLFWAATQSPRNPRDRDLRRSPFSGYCRESEIPDLQRKDYFVQKIRGEQSPLSKYRSSGVHSSTLTKTEGMRVYVHCMPRFFQPV